MSPLMHNYYSEKTGTDLVYVPLKVEPGRVEEAVKGAYALNFTGMNVTVPHKQEVMKYLVDIDEDAKAIGAVNTLVRTDGGYKGYNTDAAGLKRAMTEAGIEIRDRTCILFGAGGAARAAACSSSIPPTSPPVRTEAKISPVPWYSPSTRGAITKPARPEARS